MGTKNVVKMLAFLASLGTIAFCGNPVKAQTVNTFIESIEGRSPKPPTIPEGYDGPQTVKALMKAFDAAYNQSYSKAKVIALCKDGKDEVVYSSELAISGEIDARYSRVEWLQMLLQRGITMENFDDYRIYLSKRHTLAFLEDNPDLRKIGFLGMPLVEDREAYKVAYIDKLVAKRIKDYKKQVERAEKRIARAKKQSDPEKVEAFRKQIEQATERIRRVQDALDRLQNPQRPKWNRIKKSHYPAL